MLPTAAETKALIESIRKETEEKAYHQFERTLADALRAGHISGVETTAIDEKLDGSMLALITMKFKNNLDELGYTVKKFELVKSAAYQCGVYCIDYDVHFSK